MIDSSARQKRLADLRHKLVALTTEVVNTERELANVEAEGQPHIG